MAYDQLKSAALPRALSNVLADVAELIQREIRLARAEVSDKLATKLEGGVWMAAAGVLGFAALLLLFEAIVFAIVSLGLAPHWSCLIVAGAVGLIAAVAFAKARSDLRTDMMPERAARNLQRDISVAKEQLT
jgi:hypothetical protein